MHSFAVTPFFFGCGERIRKTWWLVNVITRSDVSTTQALFFPTEDVSAVARFVRVNHFMFVYRAVCFFFFKITLFKSFSLLFPR